MNSNLSDAAPVAVAAMLQWVRFVARARADDD